MASTINSTGTTSSLSISGDTSGALALQTNSTTAVTVDTSQNVGIGTASPASKLDVKAGSGSVISRSTSGYNFKAYYDDGRTTYTAIGYDGLYTVGAQDLVITAGQGASQVMQFRTADTERMRINSSGQLLLGRTTAINAAPFIPSTGQNSRFVSFVNNTVSAEVGYIFCNNDNSTTQYATTSDYRLKQNVQRMAGALNKVTQLNPCTYDWKTGGSSQGFIAHELQEVCPEAVVGTKDQVNEEGNPVYQGIDTSFLVATLTAAIQELNAKVDAQAATITALQAKVGN